MAANFSGCVTVAELSEILYQKDPMSTCCRENECVDEYDGVAAAVIGLTEEGVLLSSALVQVLAEYFGAAPEDLAEKVNDVVAAFAVE